MKLRRVRLPFVSVMVDIVFPFRKMSTKPDQAHEAAASGRTIHCPQCHAPRPLHGTRFIGSLAYAFAMDGRYLGQMRPSGVDHLPDVD